jgi:hypothetical protein
VHGSGSGSGRGEEMEKFENCEKNVITEKDETGGSKHSEEEKIRLEGKRLDGN